MFKHLGTVIGISMFSKILRSTQNLYLTSNKIIWPVETDHLKCCATEDSSFVGLQEYAFSLFSSLLHPQQEIYIFREESKRNCQQSHIQMFRNTKSKLTQDLYASLP
jgi:hypothetical protein